MGFLYMEKNNNMSDFDPTKPHEAVVGFGFSLYKFVQDGRYFNQHRMRVHPDTGNAWTERDDGAVDEIKAMEEAGMQKVAELAKEGVKLPTRLIKEAKEVREDLAESAKEAPRSAKAKAKAAK
jgi:hypothetical protein